MTTYRATYTIEIHSAVDIESPTEEEARDFFWHHVTRGEPWRSGHVTLRSVKEKTP